MAYTFTDISGDRIYPGAVTNAGTFSFFARFNLKSDTGGGGANRWVASINDTTAANYQLVLYFPFGSTNRLQFGFTESGVAKLAVWDTGWTTPFEAAVVGTYDGSDLNVYSAGSSTPVATLATSATPDQGSQQMGLGCVFIDPPPTVFTAPIILYEAGWYPGVVLTAAQSAAATASTQPRAIGPAPAFYWPMLNDARAMMGGTDGVVTGAVLADHTGGNLYTAGPVLGRRIGRRR